MSHHRSPTRRSSGSTVLVVVAALAVQGIVVCVMALHGHVAGLHISSPFVLADLFHRLQDGQIAVHHGDLYGMRRGAFDYPPITAFCFALLHPLGWHGLAIAWTLASVLALVVTTVVGLSSLDIGTITQRWLLASCVVLPIAIVMCVPVQSNLAWGQFGLLVLAATAVDLFVLPPRWRGVLIGATAAIKIFPGALLFWFVVRREWGALGRGVGVAAAVTVVGWLVAPQYTSAFFLHVLPSGRDVTLATGEAGPHAPWWLGAGMLPNQSLRGMLARPPFTTSSSLIWFGLDAAVALLGASVAALLLRRRDDLLAFVALWTTITLISPVSWLHYDVAVILAPLLLVRVARCAPTIAAGLVVLLGCSLVNLETPSMHLGGFRTQPSAIAFVGRNTYVVGAIVLLVSCAADLRHRRGALSDGAGSADRARVGSRDLP